MLASNDAITNPEQGEEVLVAHVRAVAGATARLVAAFKAKSDASSVNGEEQKKRQQQKKERKKRKKVVKRLLLLEMIIPFM